MSEEKRKKRKKKKPAFRKQKKQLLPGIIAFVVVVVFCSFIGYKSYELRQTKEELTEEIEVLEANIDTEEKRAEDLKEFEIYTHTKKYAEEVAKDILGYVYADEIIFKPEN